MSVTKKKFRPYASFMFPDAEREEPFLNGMSQNGWHLLKTSYWCYTFRKGESVDYQYRMDFISKQLGRAEYIQLLEDAGWEIVDTRRDELGLWAYCRKPRSDDDMLELYTDAESKLERIRHIKKAYWYVIALASIVLALIAGIGIWLGEDWGGTAIGGLIGGIIGGIVGYIAIWRKIERIKKDIL